MGIFRFWEKHFFGQFLWQQAKSPINQSKLCWIWNLSFQVWQGSCLFLEGAWHCRGSRLTFGWVFLHPQVLQLPKDRPQFWSKGRMGAKKMNSNAVRPAWLRLIHWGWDEVWSVSAVSYGSMDPSWNLMDPSGYALRRDSKGLANVKKPLKEGSLNYPFWWHQTM